jgi:hypothetical protein
MVLAILSFDIDLKFDFKNAARASLETDALKSAAEDVTAAALRKVLLFSLLGE